MKEKENDENIEDNEDKDYKEKADEYGDDDEGKGVGRECE